MDQRKDYTEAAAAIGGVLLALGVATWQLLPTFAPSWFDGNDDHAAVVHTSSKADDAPLPWNPELHKGQLDNGLNYYVLPHPKPEERAYLWLVVRSGSVHEDDDQLGLAHFVEHMAFNGTEKYEKQAIVDYLEGIGMRFGPDLNAETAFDRTIYKLKVPTDDPQAIEKGLDVLHQWASAISFDEKEVVAERGVVLEEWRARRGAQMRMAEKLLPELLKGSKYPDRLPIGTPESIETATKERLMRYYRDWYRPELMAVLAVGDFDAGEMETKIKDKFRDLKGPKSPRPRTTVEVPEHKELRAATVQDDELDQPIVLMIDKLPRREVTTYGDARRQLAELTWLLTLNFRFGELSQKPDAPFTQAATAPDTMDLAEALDMYQGVAIAKNDQVEQALRSLLTEMRRVEQHGFNPDEIERTHSQLGSLLSLAATTYKQQDGEERLKELVDTYMHGSTFIPADVYNQLASEASSIDNDDVMAAVKALVEKRSRVITMIGPEKIPMPSAAQTVEIAREVESAELSPWGQEEAAKPLMSEAPKAGTITAETTNDKLDTTEWTLSNGARVIVKKTNFKKDEILFRAAAPGGLSLVADADLVTASSATEIVLESGIGAHDKIGLAKATAGKIAQLSPELYRDRAELNGSTRPEDLETLMQLIHLHMQEPRTDKAAFDRWQARRIQEIGNFNALPETQAMQKIMKRYSNDHPRARPKTVADIEKVDFEKALSYYSQFFTDAGDFTFVFVGDVDAAALKPLVESYLASLPATAEREKPRDTGERTARGTVRERASAGREPRTIAATIFHGHDKWSFEEDIDQELVAEVLRLRLREVLREDEGGTYGAQVSPDWKDDTTERFELKIAFKTNPERAADLHEKMLAETRSLRSGKVVNTDLLKVRETWKREYEESVRRNSFWRMILSRAARRGTDASRWLDIDGKLARVNSENLVAAAKRFLGTPDRFDFYLVPDPEALAAANKAAAEEAAAEEAAAEEAAKKAAEEAAKNDAANKAAAEEAAKKAAEEAAKNEAAAEEAAAEEAAKKAAEEAANRAAPAQPTPAVEPAPPTPPSPKPAPTETKDATWTPKKGPGYLKQ